MYEIYESTNTKNHNTYIENFVSLCFYLCLYCIKLCSKYWVEAKRKVLQSCIQLINRTEIQCSLDQVAAACISAEWVCVASYTAAAATRKHERPVRSSRDWTPCERCSLGGCVNVSHAPQCAAGPASHLDDIFLPPHTFLRNLHTPSHVRFRSLPRSLSSLPPRSCDPLSLAICFYRSIWSGRSVRMLSGVWCPWTEHYSYGGTGLCTRNRPKLALVVPWSVYCL